MMNTFSKNKSIKAISENKLMTGLSKKETSLIVGGNTYEGPYFDAGGRYFIVTGADSCYKEYAGIWDLV